MSQFEFDIDSRNKLGAAVQWEDGDDFDNFVSALNRGASVPANGLPGSIESADDFKLDAVALAELKSRLAGYQ